MPWLSIRWLCFWFGSEPFEAYWISEVHPREPLLTDAWMNHGVTVQLVTDALLQAKLGGMRDQKKFTLTSHCLKNFMKYEMFAQHQLYCSLAFHHSVVYNHLSKNGTIEQLKCTCVQIWGMLIDRHETCNMQSTSLLGCQWAWSNLFWPVA
jgi:hypothetical protein